MIIGYVILTLVILLAVAVVIILALMHHVNKPRWARGQSQLMVQAPGLVALPAGRQKGDRCCRQDGSCSLRCGQLEMAQTITGAVEGVRHGEGLRALIQMLSFVEPETLRHLIEVEAAAPGTLSQMAGMLQAGAQDPPLAGPAPGGMDPSAA